MAICTHNYCLILTNEIPRQAPHTEWLLSKLFGQPFHKIASLAKQSPSILQTDLPFNIAKSNQSILSRFGAKSIITKVPKTNINNRAIKSNLSFAQ